MTVFWKILYGEKSSVPDIWKPRHVAILENRKQTENKRNIKSWHGPCGYSSSPGTSCLEGFLLYVSLAHGFASGLTLKQAFIIRKWDTTVCLFFFFKLLFWWNIHNIKFNVLMILSAQFSSIEGIHSVVQPSPSSSSRTFSSSQSEILFPSTVASQLSPPSAPGHHHHLLSPWLWLSWVMSKHHHALFVLLCLASFT